MNIASAIVLFLVFWFMTLFVILPLRLRSQGDVGEIVPGTPASAPATLNLKRKFMVVTVVAAMLWVVVFTIIVTGFITVADIDMLGIYGPGHY